MLFYLFLRLEGMMAVLNHNFFYKEVESILFIIGGRSND